MDTDLPIDLLIIIDYFSLPSKIFKFYEENNHLDLRYSIVIELIYLFVSNYSNSNGIWIVLKQALHEVIFF